MTSFDLGDKFTLKFDINEYQKEAPLAEMSINKQRSNVDWHLSWWELVNSLYQSLDRNVMLDALHITSHFPHNKYFCKYEVILWGHEY